MGFGLKMRGFDSQEVEKSIHKAASILQIEHLLERKPKELSGGQRQRVAMGRAIVRNPQVFLFDEPLSNLDAKLRVDMRSEIKALHQRLKTTSVYVTHDQVEAMTMADRIVVLNKGNIEQVGTPLELYHKPISHFVAGFLGSPPMNFIPVKLDETHLDLLNGKKFEFTQEYVGPAVLGIRPEKLQITKDADSGFLTGTIFLIEPLGSDTLLTVLIGQEKLIVRVIGDSALNLNDEVGLSWNLTEQHLFNSTSGLRIS
jgi:multiple sugar transport system ATP-binding protein